MNINTGAQKTQNITMEVSSLLVKLCTDVMKLYQSDGLLLVLTKTVFRKSLCVVKQDTTTKYSHFP